MFGYPVLISIDFDDFTSPFTPYFLLRLARYIRHSRQCFIGYPTTSNFVKIARRIFNSLLSVWIFRWNTVSRVWYITYRAIYWAVMKAKLFKTQAILNLYQGKFKFSYYTVLKLRVKPCSSGCCCFFQNPLCQNLTVPPSGKTTTVSSKESTTSAKPTSRTPTIVPTKPFSNVTLVLSGRARSVILSKLKHFSDYAITVSSECKSLHFRCLWSIQYLVTLFEWLWNEALCCMFCHFFDHAQFTIIVYFWLKDKPIETRWLHNSCIVYESKPKIVLGCGPSSINLGIFGCWTS